MKVLKLWHLLSTEAAAAAEDVGIVNAFCSILHSSLPFIITGATGTGTEFTVRFVLVSATGSHSAGMCSLLAI